ncbi:CvpA family protein [Galbibacter sp.]|uniref:CvpA family protein n=1 Tax=Galbibacter sp. TaxID=2918471 RepID=UPI003A9508D5
MNYIDIVIGGLLVYGVVRGFVKGLFIEIASILALIVGIYGAIHFSYYIGDFLEQKVDWDQRYVSLVAFALTFMVILIAVSLIGKLLTKIANFAALGFINKLFGAAFGGLKIAIILGAILVFVDRGNQTFRLIDQETLDNSITYSKVKDLGNYVFAWVIREDPNLNNLNINFDRDDQPKNSNTATENDSIVPKTQ